MDERKYLPPELDDSVYGTGPTCPPKDNGGIIALLLILVILLLGIVTVMGILNVKLFQELRKQEECAISFSSAETEAAIIQQTQADDEKQEEPVQTQPSEYIQQETQQSEPMSLQDIYTKNISSVVSITCTGDGSTSYGTGVIYDEHGYIITNAHVVDKALVIQVRLTDDRVMNAQIVGSDEISDLAVLYVEAEDLTAAQFGDSSKLRVGDLVVAIGDPLGAEFRGTYTDGIISAINRDVDVNGHTMTLIQTNAALNTGNSGGPLIDCYGQVVGINTMKIKDVTKTNSVEGLGFSIPSATVCAVAQQLISQGYVSGRPTLGLEGETLQTFYQHYYDLPTGLYITDVDRESDAYEKGIRARDILMYADETRITTMADLNQVLAQHQVDDTVTVIIYRGGKQYQLELTLMEDKG